MTFKSSKWPLSNAPMPQLNDPRIHKQSINLLKLDPWPTNPSPSAKAHGFWCSGSRFKPIGVSFCLSPPSSLWHKYSYQNTSCPSHSPSIFCLTALSSAVCSVSSLQPLTALLKLNHHMFASSQVFTQIRHLGWFPPLHCHLPRKFSIWPLIYTTCCWTRPLGSCKVIVIYWAIHTIKLCSTIQWDLFCRAKGQRPSSPSMLCSVV